MASGHCLCGKVSFTCPDPEAIMYCYCKDCQRCTGSTHAPIFFTGRDALALTGETRFHAVKGEDNGLTIQRHFCPDCGGQLFSQIAEMPDMVIMKTGALDVAPDAPVSMLLWTSSAPGFAVLPEGVPAFERNAPFGG